MEIKMIQEINSIMKILFKHTRLFTLLLTLLLLCGVANHAWAYKVTYHILTLPIHQVEGANFRYNYHLNSDFEGKRLEAVRVVVDKVTTLPELPDAYKSPLVTENSFKYYASSNVTKSGTAVAMYDLYTAANKCYHYTINDEENTVSVGTDLTGDTDIYVTYEYNEANTIADLSGNTEYNLTMSGGFLAFNRGRNNRIAVFKETLNLVNNNALVSEDFVQFEYTNDNKIPGTNITTWWAQNPSPKASVAGQFHFIFKLEGKDPYNIIIGSTYDRDYSYVEMHGSEKYNRYKWYKGSYLYMPPGEKSGFFLASDDHKEYITKSTGYKADPVVMTSSDYNATTGYFRSKGADRTYNSFAILNNSTSNGYVFMLSRFINNSGDIDNPSNNKYNFLIRDGNYNNLTYASKTLAEATKDYSTDQKIYRVKNYVFKVKKKITNEELSVPVRVSEYYTNGNPLNFVPDELKRKYVTFTGAYKEYQDGVLVTPFATFADVDDNATPEVVDGKTCKVIWLDYETNMPFETWKATTSDANSNGTPDYDELKWYNMHAEKNTKYIVSWDKTNSRIETRNSDVKYGYARKTHYAFIGDPYDLRIVGRVSSEDANSDPSTLKYMTLNAILENNAGFNEQASATTWGIVYDDDTADNKDCFRLKDNSGDKYLHIKDASGDNYPLNGTTASADAVRITVDELPKMNFTYYIMRSDNSIAVWTSGGRHEPSAKLDYDLIPKEIRSPFLNDANISLTFYGGTTDEATAISNARSKSSPITYAPDTENGGIQYIVVRYDDYAEHSSTISYINGTIQFNVRLNGQFIYYDSETGTIKSKASPTDDELASNSYKWTLGGSDPYAMTIKSEGVGKYVTIPEKSGETGVIDWPKGDETGVGKEITWSDDAPSSKFIIKASDEEHTYEVMGATGEGDYDAIEETFNFGRKDENTVKMYSDWKYISGDDVLRFELIATSAVNVTYHLIDIKNNTELLSVQTRQASTAAPSFPPEYRSPLVDSDKYIYWKTLTDAQNKSGTHPDKVSDDGDNHIYVTYTANNLVDMSGRTMYLLKYALGDQFRQEDANDGLLDPMEEFTGTTEEKKYRYQAVYPYCNGDCNFFVYGQEQYDSQQQGAASSRTRWAWYVESVKNDPYHVKIRSRQQETYPAGSGNDYNAYFRTYKPNGYSEVVTTLAWPGISGEQGTEYMVLGSAGQFRLLTSDKVDVNGDGDTSDAEDVRRAVNSFEQYWKTWNTIRLKVLGDEDAVAKQSDPNTVPATPATKTATDEGKNNRTYLTDVMGWHSYEQWAYAIRWNDYNKNGDKNKKGWESIEHWYQTVKMGEGYFDFVPTTIDPVLILLDQHGWEVMRKPLPSSPTDPDKTAKYDAIRPYDSPMVKEYYFWTKTSKRTGFHQYHTLSQQITVDGKPFTSTSLTSLPPFDATNVHDAKGNLYDQYVTYTVKDEYLKACNVSLSYEDDVVDPADSKKTYSKVTATVTGVPFLIQQGNHFAYNNSDAVGTKNVPAANEGGMSQYIIDNASKLTTTGDNKNELWYLMPNINIDSEMGYANYAHAWASDYDRKDKVQTSGFNSWAFDPYNIQISSVAHSSSYFVTDATKAEVHEGSILGNGETNALGARKTVDAALVGGWDNRTLQMTNATFMAVQDKNGNMQLMPRFDQEKRLKDFSTLVNTDDAGVAQTYTTLYRPLVYNYHIIDNSGSESLRYQGGGDLVPQTPDWFKSPLAKDYKYYFGHAAYTTSVSSEAAYTAAGTSTTYFQKTVATESEMTTAAKALTVVDDYYFKIGASTYKKVTVTKAHSGSTDATYTTANCTEADWTNAVVKSRSEVANQAAMRTAVDALINAGTYYYKLTSPSGTYMKVVVKSGSSNFPADVAAKKDLSDKEITGSLAGADLDATGSSNDVYVRYSYDEEADDNKILQGKWLTMDVNEKDAQYTTVSATAGIYSGTKPETVDGSAKEWQWKFLANSQTDPDPYAVSLYNRNTAAGTPTAVNEKTKFALLNWYDNTGVDPTAYVLAVHGTGTSGYQFVNGASMTAPDVSEPHDATTAPEANVKSTSCSYTSTNAKIVLTDDVSHTYVYKVYTNGNNGSNAVKYGVFAVSAEQDYYTVAENDYVPILPEEIRSPLLNIDQFKYYGAEADMGDEAKELKNIFGLYEDNIYVRYTAYDLNKTEYKVPNVKTVVDSKVARGETSNDASLDINNELLYNIIWYDDNMMQSTDNSSISGLASQDLQGGDAFVWKFEGNDPYAIKIKHNDSNKYAVGADALAGTATSTFMLLPSTDSEWQYGVLQVTGDNNGKKLTGFGNALTPNASTIPTKFIIFGLSTHTVIYHLLIAKTCENKTSPQTGEYIDIPYREEKGGTETEKRIYGSSQRDLTTGGGATYQLGKTLYGVNYCVNEGHITLGDPLKVPDALKRPNCKYFYYVEGVYTNEDCSRTIPYGTEGTHIDALDAQYRGLQITQMGTEPELLGKTVRINVEYQFDDGLPTNNGSDFVTNTSGTQWYTFETSDETPYLANFTYKDNIMKGKEGRIGHYTNEFLWSPVGDPYGFKMYNRYVYKNGGQPEYVMTTAAAPAADVDLNMSNSDDVTRTVFELWPSETDGYFKVPTLTIPGSATTYYLDNNAGTLKLKTSTDTEWTFGLSDALLEPYYLGAGNVGGLTTEAKSGQDKSGVKRYEEAANLIEKQSVVFNDNNIVEFTPGYYRIFSEPNSQGIKIPTYLSGYTHKTELDGSIPMHFYEKKGVTTTFEALGSGFTTTAATQGQIPIEAPEYDPASIFYITGTDTEAPPSTAPYTMQTQGLYVKENKMTETPGEASSFHVLDIGGAVILLHDGASPAERKYLHYKQTGNIYDVKFDTGSDIDDDDAAKWCMEPANKLGLYIATHSGGEEEVLTYLWYYSTYCVPFDMLIANKTEDEAHSSNAYTCVEAESPWPGTAEEARKGLHPKSIGKYNTGTYKDNDYFVPAGTPVIFSTKRATEYIKATIPTTAPSTSISTIFSYKYLEQVLPDWDNSKRVYVFGPKMEGTMSINTTNGDVNATLPSLGNTNVGFHLNANPNKEAGSMPASWTRNNYYVLHNRIYYIASGSGSAKGGAAEFVPLIFDFDEDMEEEEEMKAKPQTVDVSADKVYDVQGRCIAIGEDVLDGSWRNNVAPGLYIIGGKKIYVGK